ncbi:DUF1214 domain-containing protein [Methylobacterium sp. NEAU K]|uniref:DUF1214 domain-containing protein n=1 Tax=Methylobacterium sp. NEAU K TaxID=3064946 RepID=UPI0027362050|nr:DUF1214 domain-containing protein [Methylobacterium sp. NEAU K]MDP4004054.1 DUF1214 domain-containing protein [Methylobacterium sp. NEAU K]
MRLAIPGSSGRSSAAGETQPAPGTGSLGGAGRLVVRVWRKSSVAGLAVYALALGGVLGLASADWATSGGYPFGGVQVGAWTAWPRAGAANSDPYTRAVNARRGEIPLAVGEGLLLTAAVDDQGQALDATCSYRIGGGTPPARAWTLTVAGRGPRDAGQPPLREGFTSTEVLRAADGRFTVVLAPEVQPGNWLPIPRASGPVRLALRLYDTPVAASVGSLDRDSVPAITRLGCAS